MKEEREEILFQKHQKQKQRKVTSHFPDPERGISLNAIFDYMCHRITFLILETLAETEPIAVTGLLKKDFSAQCNAETAEQSVQTSEVIVNKRRFSKGTQCKPSDIPGSVSQVACSPMSSFQKWTVTVTEKICFEEVEMVKRRLDLIEESNREFLEPTSSSSSTSSDLQLSETFDETKSTSSVSSEEKKGNYSFNQNSLNRTRK